MKKTFQKNNFAGKRSDGTIAGTAFLALDTELNYFSSFNQKNEMIKSNVNVLQTKIAQAIVASNKREMDLFTAKDEKGKQYFVGIAQGGSVRENIMIVPQSIMEEGDKTSIFYGDNVSSHHFSLMLLGIERYLRPLGELDKNYRKIDFSQGYIDANQRKQFFICNDVIYFARGVLFDGKKYESDAAEIEKKLAELEIEKNITKFICANPNSCDDLTELTKQVFTKMGLDDMSSIPMEELPQPAEKLYKKKELADFLQKDYSILCDEDVEQLTPFLKAQLNAAKQSFIENKDFLTLKDWQLIDAIYEGDVRSLSMIGPAGVGKTTIARTIAGALNLPLVVVGGSDGIEESELFGYERLSSNPEGTGTVTKWADGPFTEAIRYGGMVLFDEVNAAEPGVIMKLNTVLDGTKSISLSSGECVPVHPNFIYCEAMNNGSGYHGTKEMNVSHMDRMDRVIFLKAKSSEEEAKIVANITQYKDIESLRKMCEVKNFILQMIKSDGDESSQITSLRRIISWVKEAATTGEFIESSLDTIISHIAIGDDDVEELTVQEVSNSSGIARVVLEKISNIFEDTEFDYTLYKQEGQEQ